MIRPLLSRVHQGTAIATRSGVRSRSSAASYNTKYADKLQLKAQEKGLDLDKLRLQARREAHLKEKKEAASLLAPLEKTTSEYKARFDLPETPRTANARKDSSPVKPLSSILNLSKLLATPHTSSQISALWTAYHASRSKGTGRGYICASLPLETYSAMTRIAKKYPVFVVPVPRGSTPDPNSAENAGTGHEFFFLQWDFHPSPSAPAALESNPFEPAAPTSPPPMAEPSTALFTPLQEYKLRASFATPYLVLTFYTDLSQSHGIVLLRGEITPSSAPAAVQSGQETPERFLLNQVDAQLLAMQLQRFYLWGDGKKGDPDVVVETLLKRFHEEPEKFSWQELLKSSNVIA